MLDLLTYGCLLALIVYMTVSPERIDDVVLETDDLIVISVIIFR